MTNDSSKHGPVVFHRSTTPWCHAVSIYMLGAAALGVWFAFALADLCDCLTGEHQGPGVVVTGLALLMLACGGWHAWMGFFVCNGTRVRVFAGGTVIIRFMFGFGRSRTWTGHVADIESVGIRQWDMGEASHTTCIYVDVRRHGRMWLAKFTEEQIRSFAKVLNHDVPEPVVGANPGLQLWGEVRRVLEGRADEKPSSAASAALGERAR